MFENTVKIDNEALRYIPMEGCDRIREIGRCTRDREHIVLFWTGSGIELKVRASEVWIEIESAYNIYEPWASIKVNGALMSRQMLPKGRYFIPAIRNMNPEEEKTIRLYKDVQAMSGDDMHSLRILGILTDGELLEVERPGRRLEFIGDSITSGEGIRGAKKEWDWISMFFDSVHDYATLTAEALGADHRILSQSGWGVFTGWDNNPSSVLPAYYDKVCGLAFGEKNIALGAQEKNDFTAWQPDVIVINLGTNDGGAFSSPAFTDPVTGKVTNQVFNEDGTLEANSVARFKEAVKVFLAQLRYHNPEAKLLWAYGMLGDLMEKPLLEAIEEYKNDTNDKCAEYIRLPLTTPETVGSREHPGMKAHEAAAAVLIEKIEELLK